MKVAVTGAAGMIGSNLVHGLNALGIDDVIAVDDLTDGPKYRNLLGAKLSDYFDKSEFYARFAKGEFGKNIHELDGRIIMMQHHPMKDGGFVSTHEDITEQRQ